jgi:hypothetical protein
MDKARAGALLTWILNIALAILVLYEFWQFYSVGSVDLFGRTMGPHTITYSERPDDVLAGLAIYAGMLAYCTILSVREWLSQRADNT